MAEQSTEMNDYKSKINNQLIDLFSTVKFSDKIELELDIFLQIVHFKEINKNEKKFYLSTLCDNKHKYNGFLLLPKLNADNSYIEIGNIINIQKITSKRVKKGFFIIVKQYQKISNTIYEINSLLIEIKEENGDFLDNQGNFIIKEKTIENIIIKNDPLISIPNYEDKKEEKIESEPMEEEAYSSLKQLTTFSRDFIIFIRVTKKSDIKTFETRYNHQNYNYNISYTSNNNQGKLFYFDVMDKEGNEMQCTCFNKSVDKFFLLIEKGYIYKIKGGM